MKKKKEISESDKTVRHALTCLVFLFLIFMIFYGGLHININTEQDEEWKENWVCDEYGYINIRDFYNENTDECRGECLSEDVIIGYLADYVYVVNKNRCNSFLKNKCEPSCIRQHLERVKIGTEPPVITSNYPKSDNSTIHYKCYSDCEVKE